MIKRLSIIGFLVSLFLVAVIGLSSCGAAEELASTDLQNAVGSGNGPGSGNWQPPKPENKNQCTQLYNTVDAFRINIDGEVETYTNGFNRCFDKDGNLREGQDPEDCYKALSNVADGLKADYTDFRAGFVNYGLCNNEGPALTLPRVPDVDPVTTQGILPGGDWSNWTGCLTCTRSIESREFVFIPLEVDLAALDDQS